MDDIPFDLRHLNHITYAPLKMKKFDSDLRETLRFLRENSSLSYQEAASAPPGNAEPAMKHRRQFLLKSADVPV